MNYRNRKRKAAIWILENICRPNKARVTGLRNFEGVGSYKEINEKYYDSYKLQDLINEDKEFNKEILRDAVDFLFINNQLILSDNESNIYDITIKAKKEGEIALREDVYQDEIDEYKSNNIYRNTRWWLPLLALIVAAAVFGYTVYKDTKKEVDFKNMQAQIEELKLNLQKTEQEVNTLKPLVDKLNKDNTSHSKISQ